jgi:hypothetical protein
VALEQPSFLLSPRSAPSADGCLTIDHPTYRVSEYELHGVPFDYAVPVLAGWDLWYPCGDEHVGEIGVWLHDIEYQKDADDPHGVLRYKVTSVLRDRDSRPGHRSRPRVSILGLRAPRPRTEDLRFEDAIVGFLSLAPDVHGRVLNGSDQSLWLTSGQEGGAQPEEFLFEVEYRGNMFLLEELAQHAPLELLPGEELIVGGRFLPSVPAPPGAPRSAWVDFAASDARWPSIRVHATGLTVAEDAAGHVLPEVIHFGFVDFQTSNHPLGFPVRNGFLGSNGQTPLLIESLSLTDPAIGFSFTVVQAPPFDGLLAPGVLYQVGPGHFLDFQVRFVPVVPGPVETTLVAETNVGRFEVRLLGEGVGTPPRPEFEVLRPRLGWPPATLTGR